LREEEAQASFGPKGIPPATGSPLVVYWMSGPLPGPTTSAFWLFSLAHDWQEDTSPGSDVNSCPVSSWSPAGHLLVSERHSLGVPYRPVGACV